MKKSILIISSAIALATASPALAAAPSIGSVSAPEGVPLTVPIAHLCKAKKCRYAIRTVDATATAGSDYTAVTATGKAKKNKTFRTTLTIPTTPDTTCEPDEIFAVHVDVINGSGVHGYNATETITDDDCTTTPPATPAPTGYQPPANPDGAEISEDKGSVHDQQTCYEAYTQGTVVAPGYRLPECYVAVTCPASATNGCAGYAGWAVEAEFATEFSVSGWGLVHTYDAAGNELTMDEQYCNDYAKCSMQEPGQLSVKPGQTLEADCGGHFDPNKMAPGSDRAPEYEARASCYARVNW